MQPGRAWGAFGEADALLALATVLSADAQLIRAASAGSAAAEAARGQLGSPAGAV